MPSISRLFCGKYRVYAYSLVTSVIIVFVFNNLIWSNSTNLFKLYRHTLREEVSDFRMFDVHEHNMNIVDKFNYSTSTNCSSLDVLYSIDPSISSVDPNIFCDDRAQSSDVVCRWFLSQIGMNGIGDPHACTRQGSDTKVPKIVYYVIFGPYTFQFWHYVSVVAAKRFINPSAIYIIGDAHPLGDWWKQVLRDVKGVRFVYRETPPGIDGKLVKWKHHLSDLVRLQVLYANGGIYLDTDMIVTRPLDALLDYDITMGLLDNGTGMGNAIILAKRGSVFVRNWYESYKGYKSDEFYRNSLQVPRDMWHKDPQSIHMETERFYQPNWYEADKLFKANDYPWRNNYAIHIWTNQNPVPKRLEDIQKLNTTLGQVFRHVLYGSPDIR